VSPINVSTIGFTRTSAENFFERLSRAGVRKVIDVRLNNRSQLAGFAKAGDLAYLLGRIGGIGYEHMTLLAPGEAMLSDYRRHRDQWSLYAARFVELMAERKIESQLKPGLFDGACLLCSEVEPDRCHRRLICDYLNRAWDGALTVRHL
jgi:uncharacterized protein (DUF488 family)